MSNPFRQAFDEARDDGSVSSRLIRGSLLAAESKFYPPRQAYLSVEILGAEVEAYLSSEVALAVSDTAAYFAKAIDSPRAMNARISNSFRKKVGLKNLGSFGNRIVLGFTQPADDPDTPLIDESQLVTLGESSVRSLALSLPNDSEDDQSLDNALGLRPVERNGLFKLAETLSKFNRSVQLGLNVKDQETVGGILTASQASVLNESLKESSLETWKSDFSGRLDGMRSRRRQFFLELGDGTEIAGTIDPELIDKLPRYIDKQVNVRVVCQQPMYKNGRTGKVAYRLESIEGVSEEVT